MPISPGVLILAVLGCIAAPSGEGEPPTRDETNSLVLEVEVGHKSGTEFAYVSDAAVSEDGSLYVLDSRSRHVLWFDSSGNFVGALGGPGEGPGEFKAPVAIAIDGDHVMIWDIGAWRVTTFDTRGALVGTESVPPRRESGWPVVVRYSQEGEWLYLDQEIETPDQAGVEVQSGIIRGVAHLLSWRSGSQWIERDQFPGMEAALVEYDGELALSNAPFPAGPLWAPGNDGWIWYADSRSYSISKRGGGTVTTDAITANAQGPEVTDSAWHTFIGGSAGDPATPEARQRSKLPRPDMQPVLAQLVSNRRGNFGFSSAIMEEVSQASGMYTRRMELLGSACSCLESFGSIKLSATGLLVISATAWMSRRSADIGSMVLLESVQRRITDTCRCAALRSARLALRDMPALWRRIASLTPAARRHSITLSVIQVGS